MDAKAVVGYIVSAILLIFGILFALASVYALTRLITGVVLMLVAIAIIYLVRRRAPIQITQKLEVPGQIKVQTLRCPNCSAVLDVTKIKILGGMPYVTCPYCGNTFEVTEEPKW